MQHIESIVKIHQSDDYSQFNMIKGNRNLDLNKIKKILADIERGTDLLKYCPVLVVEKDGRLDIIDGQHRFMVAKKVKSPVYYIIAETLSLYDIARMNSNTEKWKAKDFINCYKELGNDNYIKLEKLMLAFPKLPVTTALSLLSAGKIASGGNEQDKFQRGEFTAKHEEKAHAICNKVEQFAFDAKFSRPFMTAILKVIDAGLYDLDELSKKVNENIGMLQLQDHWRKYLSNMEEIVSRGKQKRVAIY